MHVLNEQIVEEVNFSIGMKENRYENVVLISFDKKITVKRLVCPNDPNATGYFILPGDSYFRSAEFVPVNDSFRVKMDEYNE